MSGGEQFIVTMFFTGLFFPFWMAYVRWLRR